MATGPSSPRSSAASTGNRPKKRGRPLLTTFIIVVALVIAFVYVSQVYTEVLWYNQLGYIGIFLRENFIKIGVFLAGFLLMALAMWVSLRAAWKHRPAERPQRPRPAAGGEQQKSAGADPMRDLQAVFNQNMERYQQALEPMRRILMIAIPVVVGLFGGLTLLAQWDTVALFFAREPFGQTDPQFGFDLSFFMFTLPFLRLVAGYVITVLVLAGIGALVTQYLYGGIVVHERGIGTSKAVKVHLGIIAALFLIVLAGNFWLGRYSTLLSNKGSWTGALFTDVNAVMPTNAILAIAAVIVAALFVYSAFAGRWRLPLIGTAMLLVVSLVAGGLYPWAVQRFQVTPTEQAMEKDFIQRNIDMTRNAYGLSDIKSQNYEATVETGQGALDGDTSTVSNIRLLDPNVVSNSFAQLQQFRPYYQFGKSLSVDRYNVDGKNQDTVISARELNPEQNQGWYNQHVVYTHGYGVVAAYGNQVEADGKPKFMQEGISAKGVISQDYQPRIYFGQSSPDYSIVGGSDGDENLELDRPQTTDDKGAGDAKYTYTGQGGPKIGNWFNRLAYAIKYQSSDLLLSNAVRPDSQILYNRDPADRVSKVAPYLKVDGNPYPAIVDNKVVWMVDAYTTSSNYPYSTPTSLGDATQDSQTKAGGSKALPNEKVNYIRNSVKATVNAYDGSVDLYAWDDQDPVLKAWQKVFPTTVKPYSEMSADLMNHVRYPEDLFKVQRELLNRYHVTDANSFYASDDVWQTPKDPTQDQATDLPPYYMSLQMPGDKRTRFSLTSSFIPQQSDSNTRNVMYGFVSANGDAGTGKDGVKDPDYGTMNLLELPRNSVVPGPGQAQNLFDSDTNVSTELNLLRQGASRVVNGNLLTLPVGGGILYVQPVYVQSSGDASYPTLRRVLVGFGEKVGFAPTLDEALNELFDGNSGAQTSKDAGVDASQADSGKSDQGDSGSSGESPDLKKSLEDANKAMQDSSKAMKDGDWAAYGQAQDRLNKALDEALKADGASASPSPSPSASPSSTNGG
ncbi:UPF0182 family protein [Curtobacterium sp. S6]|uniref:UPF0182 family membrane protein n=1 Tax=Curtobacterium sp. S6 TaxID=1479623 RepID=UPI00056503B3|nr:UPF0182 family protein [Curtobacterium sp. S6]